MSLKVRMEYRKVLRERYWKARGRREKSQTRRRSLLRQKIPVRLTEWDTSKQGYLEIDLVVHCGCSTRGEYINTLSALRSPPDGGKGKP